MRFERKFSLFKEIFQVGNHSAARDPINFQARHPEEKKRSPLIHVCQSYLLVSGGGLP